MSDKEYPEHELTFSLGFTIQPADFQFIRHDLALTLKGKPGESPDQTYEKAKRWVEGKTEAKLTELNEDD